MHQSAEEGAGRHDYSLAVILNFQSRFDPKGAPVGVKDLRRLTLLYIQVGFPFAHPLQSELVSFLVALCPGRPNCWTPLRIQHPKLKPCHIRGLADLAAQSIDLP